VAIPLFADQLYNAALAKHKGIGVYVDVRKLNEHSGQNLMIQELGKVRKEGKHVGKSILCLFPICRCLMTKASSGTPN
jgi:hypothetical protein